MLTPLRQYAPCRISHSHPIIIACTGNPIDSILPGVAPEALTLTRSAVDVSYFVSATEENLINESDHALLSIICFDGLIIHTNPLFGYNNDKFF